MVVWSPGLQKELVVSEPVHEATLRCGCHFRVQVNFPQFRIDVNQCAAHAHMDEVVEALRFVATDGLTLLSPTAAGRLDRVLNLLGGA
jgi:hypothetical protein